MKFLKSKIAAFMTDMVCCVLLGASVCAALFPLTGIKTGFGDCLLLTAAAVALVVLFTRKWWLFPAAVGSAIAVTLLITTILDANEELWSYIEGFFRWWGASFPEASVYSQNGGIFIVQFALALPAAAMSYLYFRRLFFFPLLPPIALALLLWMNASRSDAFWPVFIMMLTVVFISIAKMTGNRINRSLPESDRISSALLATTAMILTPVIVFFAFAVSPKDDGEWQSKGLYNLVGDIGDYFGWNEGDVPYQGSFSIGVSGFSPLENRLGGDVTLSNKKVMSVITSSPARLKGAVYDTYDGHMWYDTAALRRYRFESSFWQDDRTEAFGLIALPDGRAKELIQKITHSADFNINYTERGRTLFFTGQVQSLESRYMDVSEVFFNSQSELFTEKPQWSMHYTVHTIVFDRSMKGFDSNIIELESLTGDIRDDGLKAIRDKYLQLPDTVPQSVHEKAAEITQGCTTGYEKARAIEQWIAANCAYSLTPGAPPENTDFVAYFLENREGYCVYFASAMTVLARSAGLPARFVTGYALKRDPSLNASNSYIATSSTAHAWTEIYLKGIGWLTFDPAAWNFDEAGIVNEFSAETGNPIPSPAPTASMDIEDSDSAPKGMSNEAKIILITLACLAGGLGLFTAVRFVLLLKGGNIYYKSLCRKYDSAEDRINACYGRILRQVSFLGLKQKNEDTITSFAHRVDDYLGSYDMTNVCEYVIRMRYASQIPDDKGVRILCAFSASLEKQLRKSLGLSGYLWRRVLLGR